MALDISVALATYNGARYVVEQVRSILDQSRPIDELVVSDDASSDSTVELIEDAVAHHPRAPRLVISRNATSLGVTANFEQALAAATGDIVLLSDQDDLWHPDRVRATEEAFLRHPDADLLASDARLVDAEGRATGESLFGTLGVSEALVRRLSGAGAVDELLRRNLLTGATMGMRRRLIEHARPFPASWVHDEWLAMAAAVGGGIIVLDRQLIDYRQHGSNQIGVSRLGAGGKLGRLREPRAARNSRLLARARDLDARSRQLSVDEAFGDVARAKLAHEQMRSALPVARRARVSPIVRAWRAGAYDRFGLGAPDVLRDLVQPAGQPQSRPTG